VSRAAVVGRSWQRDRQAFHRFRVTAQRFGQAHHDVKTAVALEQRAGLLAADGGGYRLLYVADIEAVARSLVSVDLDAQHRQAGGLLDLYRRLRPAPFATLAIFSAVCVEVLHVVTEQLDRHVAAHAGDQLVETQLDRLRKLVVTAGQLPPPPPARSAISCSRAYPDRAIAPAA
jgi:hypothetical protein